MYWIKPAYLFSDSLTDVWQTINNQCQQNQTDSTRREAYNEDNERVTDQRRNENSSISGENRVIKKT